MANIDLSDLKMAFEATEINPGAAQEVKAKAKASKTVKAAKDVVEQTPVIETPIKEAKAISYAASISRAPAKSAHEIHMKSVPSEPRTHTVAVDVDSIAEPKTPDPIPVLDKSIDGVMPSAATNKIDVDTADHVETIGDVEASFIADGDQAKAEVDNVIEPQEETVVEEFSVDAVEPEVEPNLDVQVEQPVAEVEQLSSNSLEEIGSDDSVITLRPDGADMIVEPVELPTKEYTGDVEEVVESGEGVEKAQQDWVNKSFADATVVDEIASAAAITKVDIDGNAVTNEDLKTELDEKTEQPHTGKSGSLRLKLIWTLLLLQALLLIVFFVAFVSQPVYDFLNGILTRFVDLF